MHGVSVTARLYEHPNILACKATWMKYYSSSNAVSDLKTNPSTV